MLPNQYIHASPRISHRRHLLKPCRETNEAFKYLLGYCANKHNMVVYSACLMPTHYHLVMNDRDGQHPKFFMDFNRMLADFIQKKYGIDGNVFSPKPPRVVCLAPEGVLDKIAYTLASPVIGGGSRNVHEWPGFRTRVDEMGQRVIRARRPKQFAHRKNLPEEVMLALGFPPALEAHYGSREAVVAEVNAATKKYVASARRAIKNKGWTYLGKHRAPKVDHLKQAAGWEVFDRKSYRLSTVGLSKEAADKAWEALRNWTARYHSTRLRFLEGARSVLWPYGTWAMVQNFGMQAEPPPCVT